MIRIEALTLEKAYEDAAKALNCSITQLKIEVVQVPSKGLFGLFKKSAIIVAVVQTQTQIQESEPEQTPKKQVLEQTQELSEVPLKESGFESEEEEDILLGSGLEYTADYDDEYDEYDEPEDEEETESSQLTSIAVEVEEKINALFDTTCFDIEKIQVSVFDTETLLIAFKGEDAALLIGKEGYRYKALSYMIFNWINTEYDMQLRLEIAEFLQNQEESIGRYLEGIYQNIEKDGRVQTKILDGILVQIALKELRNRYPEKYIVIRSTKDGLKYIIVNDYYNN